MNFHCVNGQKCMCASSRCTSMSIIEWMMAELAMINMTLGQRLVLLRDRSQAEAAMIGHIINEWPMALAICQRMSK